MSEGKYCWSNNYSPTYYEALKIVRPMLTTTKIHHFDHSGNMVVDNCA